MMQQIKIVADDRERRSGIPEFFANVADIDLVVERMLLGDYFVDDRLLFERKTLKDLIHSIIDGRIFSQAARLVDSEYQAIFILEGTSSDIRDFKMKRQAIQGALIYVSVIMGIPVLRSTSAEETASLMLATARQVRNVADGTVLRHGHSPKGKRRRQMFILQGLPKIGKKRATVDSKI
jgi:DNA excision repair protein ERCC-4